MKLWKRLVYIGVVAVVACGTTVMAVWTMVDTYATLHYDVPSTYHFSTTANRGFCVSEEVTVDASSTDSFRIRPASGGLGELSENTAAPNAAPYYELKDLTINQWQIVQDELGADGEVWVFLTLTGEHPFEVIINNDSFEDRQFNTVIVWILYAAINFVFIAGLWPRLNGYKSWSHYKLSRYKR